jgi:hypothetical protein
MTGTNAAVALLQLQLVLILTALLACSMQGIGCMKADLNATGFI